MPRHLDALPWRKVVVNLFASAYNLGFEVVDGLFYVNAPRLLNLLRLYELILEFLYWLFKFK